MKHLLSFSGLMAAFSAVPAMAQENLRIDGLEIIGEPVDGKMGFQPAVTRVAQDIHDLDHLILIIITLITIFKSNMRFMCIYIIISSVVIYPQRSAIL